MIAYILLYIIMGIFILGGLYGIYMMIRDDIRSERKRAKDKE